DRLEPSPSAERYYDHYGIGVVRLEHGAAAAAIAPLDRAIVLRSEDGSDPAELADAQFALARALIATRGDRVRAFALAHHARSGYENARPGQRARVDDVDAWLAEHR